MELNIKDDLDAEMHTIRHLLNRLVLTTSDEYTETDELYKQLQSVSKLENLDFSEFANNSSIPSSYAFGDNSQIDDIKEETPSGQQDLKAGADIENLISENKDGINEEDRNLLELEKENVRLVAILERQEFFGDKLELLLERDQQLIESIRENLINRKKFDINYSTIYNQLYDEKCSFLEKNIEILDKNLRFNQLKYTRSLENIRKMFSNLSEVLKEEDK
ncbi:hypothetical protein BVG19_g228 [[Candida] boidinii]|nr:hypothetical protein BVG19_g228 [[Candida] boidinii]OWB49787.1 hypothetical protein B5S27_g1331 [[Candida] boidinii]OWB68684.1 hypothetical protein B5S30_g4069 [[Candida] boidinii]OWB82464.1 hypothetical protein B5S33_g1090 [[Candida] boidinii]